MDGASAASTSATSSPDPRDGRYEHRAAYRFGLDPRKVAKIGFRPASAVLREINVRVDTPSAFGEGGQRGSKDVGPGASGRRSV